MMVQKGAVQDVDAAIELLDDCLTRFPDALLVANLFCVLADPKWSGLTPREWLHIHQDAVERHEARSPMIHATHSYMESARYDYGEEREEKHAHAMSLRREEILMNPGRAIEPAAQIVALNDLAFELYFEDHLTRAKRALERINNIVLPDPWADHFWSARAVLNAVTIHWWSFGKKLRNRDE